MIAAATIAIGVRSLPDPGGTPATPDPDGAGVAPGGLPVPIVALDEPTG